jgi:ribosome-associated protein
VATIPFSPGVNIDERDLSYRFIRSPGPGGQNVNKVSTSAQLRFDLAGRSAIPAEVRQRLTKLAGRRIGAAGVLVITARRYRSQERNRRDALERLISLLRRAGSRPPRRRRTRPTRASVQRRLEQKREHGRKKALRGRRATLDQ